jgi:AcrR family transcriptional regulator
MSTRHTDRSSEVGASSEVLGTAAVDGRVLRGERTRTAIVEALLQLLEQGESRPTARMIAARAGVSVRSIFQHFDDLEGLYGDLVTVQAARVQPLVDALSDSGDVEARVDDIVRQRSELFEAIAPMRHAVGTRARHSAVLARRIRELSDMLHRQVGEQFRQELAGEGADLALALDLICSFESWDHLREHHGLDVAGAAEVLRGSLRRLLAVT